MRAVRLDQILKDLAHRCSRGPQAWLRLGGKARDCVLHALLDLRTREVQVDIVLVRDRDDGDARLGDGAHATCPRQPHHGCLHRVADEVLDFVRRQSGCDGDDLHLVRRQVGKRVVIDAREGPRPRNDQEQRGGDHGHAKAECERHETFDHDLSPPPFWSERTRISRRRLPRLRPYRPA